MRPFLAMITPVGDLGSPVDPGWGVGGPGSPGGPGGPGSPGGPGPVYPAHPIAGGPWPTHPIAGPQPPQGGGGGAHPEHPIYFPPESGQPPLGIWGPPDMPPGFWGGGMGPGVKPQPHPEHPIVLPPDLPAEIPPPNGGEAIPIEWKTGWTQVTGWVIVGIPTVPHPTPSK
jgi:hypothetical protein